MGIDTMERYIVYYLFLGKTFGMIMIGKTWQLREFDMFMELMQKDTYDYLFLMKIKRVSYMLKVLVGLRMTKTFSY